MYGTSTLFFFFELGSMRQKLNVTFLLVCHVCFTKSNFILSGFFCSAQHILEYNLKNDKQKYWQFSAHLKSYFFLFKFNYPLISRTVHDKNKVRKIIFYSSVIAQSIMKRKNDTLVFVDFYAVGCLLSYS